MKLQTCNLSITRGNNKVLHHINAAFPDNATTLLIGRNGSGKSTLLKALAGIIPATSGSISLDGTPLTVFSRLQLARRCAVLLQNPYAPPEMTVREVVLAGRFPYGRYDRRKDEAAADAMDELGISALSSRKTGTLSGGERHKVFLARALAQESEILLLDEPDSALDSAAKDMLRQTLHKLRTRRRMCIIMAVHDLDFALDCADHLCGISNGRIIFAGTPEHTATPENMKQLYGTGSRIFTDECGRLRIITDYSKLNS